MPNENNQHHGGTQQKVMPPPPPHPIDGGPKPYHNGAMSPKNSKYLREDPAMQQQRQHRHPSENKHHNNTKRTIADVSGFNRSKYSREYDEKMRQRQRRRPPVPAMPPVPKAPIMPAPSSQIGSEKTSRHVNASPMPMQVQHHRQPAPISNHPKQESVQLASYEKSKSNYAVKAVFINLFLLVIATGLEFIRIKFSFIPSFITIDIGIFPEFISLLFFGPLVAVPLIMLKNIFHMLVFYILNGSISYVGELSNFLRDIIFVMIAFIAFRMFINSDISMQDRAKRRLGVFTAGSVSAVATAFVTLPIMNSIIYPLFSKFFEAKQIEFDILGFYVEKMSSIETIWQGLLIFNLPLELVKLMAVTIVATIVYVLATARE